MSAIVIPRTHLKQPSGLLNVNAADSLSRGLVLLQGAFDFARGSGTPVGAPSRAITPSGVAFSSAPSKYFSEVSPYQPVAGGAFAVAFELYYRSMPGEQVGLWTFGSTPLDGSPRFLIAGDAANNAKVYWSSAYRITSSSPPVVGGRVRVVFSYEGGTGSLWVNGVAIGSATEPINNGANAQNWYLGSGYNQYPNADFVWHAQWSRGLTFAEVARLSINPWQLFRADPIRIYSLPSGPVGISWSSLTASNITQTGARLTLGGITR